MRAVALICLLGACAPGPPPPRSVVIAAPPQRPVIAAPVIEPSLSAGGCSIGGQSVSLVGDSIDLCGALGTACFGRLPAHTYTGVTVESLRVAPSLAAHVVLSANGVTVSAIVDARQWAPHPKRVEIVDEWFVPEGARLSFVRVRDGAAELTIEHDPDLTPVAPLAVDWACDRLTSETPRVDLTEIEDAMGLGHQVEVFVAPPAGSLDIRASPRAAPAAKLQCAEQLVYVYARSGGLVRGVIPVDGGWAVGWIDGARLRRPDGAGHRTRAPTVRMGLGESGAVRCDHDVDVLAQVGGATVHAATIHRGTGFDPQNAADALGRVGVELLPAVTARISPEAIADCL